MLRSNFAAIGLVLLLHSSASAIARLDLSVTPGDGSAAVVLRVQNDVPFQYGVYGFDIYRYDSGAQAPNCGRPTRVASLLRPWSHPEDFADYSFSLQDAGLVSGRVYTYSVAPVGINHEVPRDAESQFSGTTVVMFSTGQATLAESATAFGSASDGRIVGCILACAPFADQVVGLPAAIIGDQRFYRMLGTIRPGPVPNRFVGVIEEVMPADCNTALAPAAWGSVKALFR